LKPPFNFFQLRKGLRMVRHSHTPLDNPESHHASNHQLHSRLRFVADHQPPRARNPSIRTLVFMRIALDEDVRRESVENLNQLLADAITLRDLYRKHHWQVSGPTFYQLHLLFDKHYEEQDKLVDTIAERIMKLGGVSIAMSADVADMTLVPRPPKGREGVQISRLLHAHEIVLEETRAMARLADDAGDAGTNDLLVGTIIRTNETQAWFVAEHLIDGPLVHADCADND